ncbi:MAG: glucoamylase family protein [Candidatus Xenobia bacterium]
MQIDRTRAIATPAARSKPKTAPATAPQDSFKPAVVAGLLVATMLSAPKAQAEPELPGCSTRGSTIDRVVPRSAHAQPGQLLDRVQKAAFQYFWDQADPATGLVLDRANNQHPSGLDYSAASIASTGFGLSAIVAAAQKGWVDPQAAQERIRTTLDTFLNKMPNVHGFFYHFVDTHTGQRMWKSEVSSIDTALFLAGALTAAQAWPGTDIEKMANQIYDRVDWRWMMNGGKTLSMGWLPDDSHEQSLDEGRRWRSMDSPECGSGSCPRSDAPGHFIPSRWDHYDESSILDILAIGSRTHPIPPSTWQEVKRQMGDYKGHQALISPPLFTHQYSQLYLDLRGLTDGKFDYFDSSREATLINRQYCIDREKEFKTFGPDSWGLTASDGPDGYRAYGAPPGTPDTDGTVAPTGPIGSYEFTPRKSYAALQHMVDDGNGRLWGRYGLTDAYNDDRHWMSPDVLGIDQGAETLSIENARTGLIWKLFMANPGVQRGLALAGFHPSGKGGH